MEQSELKQPVVGVKKSTMVELDMTKNVKIPSMTNWKSNSMADTKQFLQRETDY